MAPNMSKFLTRDVACATLGISASLSWILFQQYKNWKSTKHTKGQVVKELTTQPSSRQTKPGIDLDFLKKLLCLIKIVIPGFVSTETAYALLISIISMAKTFYTLWLIQHTTATESALVSGEKFAFIQHILKFMVAIPIISLVDNALKYVTGELQIRMRKNLSFYLYHKYLTSLNYYRLSNLDNRIPNVDYLLVTDAHKFCDCLSECYSNISSSLVDIGIFMLKTSTNVSLVPAAVLFGYVLISGALLSQFRKPTTRLKMIEQKLEGEFRHVSTRVTTYSEEIAFYNGNVRERELIMTSFNKIINHIRNNLHFNVITAVVDHIIGKYFATAIGWLSFALTFFSKYSNLSIIKRSQIYYTNAYLLLNMSQAIGRLVLSGRELAHLVSFTHRIAHLQQVLQDVSNGNYERIMSEVPDTYGLNAGTIIIQDNIIKFDRVPVVTPNREVLIKELSVEIRSGINVLVCGPNGAGKSSIFRILGELWPLLGGELTKPQSGKLFYVPQKPYMTLGSLRDQITYPHCDNNTNFQEHTDDRLKHFLGIVQLEYLLEREGGLNAIADWFDILSGGEKQRIAMARLFFHSPQFAILDECTSAVSVDVENIMYGYCREMSITLLTVSHRKSLWKHHEYVLQLDGRGSYTFNPIVMGMEQFGS